METAARLEKGDFFIRAVSVFETRSAQQLAVQSKIKNALLASMWTRSIVQAVVWNS
jgi:hypothetical protein